MTTQHFNPNRKFGVEIEFLRSPDRQVRSLVTILRNKGLIVEEQGYNHNTASFWKIVPDSSCGLELVSPPLQGQNGLDQVRLVCEGLREWGAAVDKKCGLHIHHSVAELTVPQMANIFAIYTKLERTFDALQPESRRAANNTYCTTSVSDYHSDYERNRFLTQLSKVKSQDKLDSLVGTSRYRKVNFKSYVKYGTIEFRHHAGTTNATKILNWILLTQQVVETAKARSIQKSYNRANDNLQGLRNVLRLIPAKGASQEVAEMYKWYCKRANSLGD